MRGEEPLLANSNKKYKLILNAGHIPLKSSHPRLVFLASAGDCVSGALWLIVRIIHVWKFLFCREYWKTNGSQTPSDTRPSKWPIIKIILQIKFSYIKDSGKLSSHCKKNQNILSLTIRTENTNKEGCLGNTTGRMKTRKLISKLDSKVYLFLRQIYDMEEFANCAD